MRLGRRQKTDHLGHFSQIEDIFLGILIRVEQFFALGRFASPLVFQALSYFGKDGVTQGMISRLRSLLTAKDKADLKSNLHHAPAWLQRRR